MFDFYRRIGADLIPLHKYQQGDKNSKRPLLPSWTTIQHDHDSVIKLFEAGHSVGYRPKAHELIIDVEAATPGGHAVDGRASFAKLVDDFQIDLTKVPRVTSPKGGCHYYFTKHEKSKISSKALKEHYPGIDFLSKGTQVVAAGSQHWQGGFYKLDSIVQLTDMVPPEAPLELVSALSPPPFVAGNPDGGIIDPDDLRELLSYLEAVDYGDNDSWQAIMMACHHATGGEGYEVFEEWSWSDPKWTGCPDVKTRWESLHDKKDRLVTFQTLFSHVRDKCRRTGNARGLNFVSFLQDTRTVEALSQKDEDGNLIAPVDPFHITCDFYETSRIDQALESLARCPNLYSRGGRLVRVTKEDEPPAWQQNTENSYAVRELNIEALREMLGQYCSFFNLENIKNEDTGEKELIRKRTRCPTWLRNGLYNRNSFRPIPPLEAIVQTPCILKDGSILWEPGFNDDHGLLYKPNREYLPVDPAPSLNDAKKAVSELYEVVYDFPFVSPDHKSVWLAAVLTMLARHSYRAPTPLFFFDGNTSGVGKSLLIDTVGLIAIGNHVPKMSYPPNNEEMDKRLTTVIRNAAPMQLLDNVPNNKDFGFPSLDAVITSGIWEARILGKSETTGPMPVTTMFCATGNNLRLGIDSDAARRIAYCRINCNSENPSARTGFLHSDLPAWILENRPRLVQAGLTVLKAYQVAGKPRVKRPNWGSFEEWSAAVRDPIVWLGEPDPMNTRQEMSAHADCGRDNRLMVLLGWKEVAGDDALSVSEMLERVDKGPTAHPAMQEALNMVLDEKRVRHPAAIGKELQKYLDQTTNGMKLIKETKRNTGHYRVVCQEELYDFLK